jgi:hypothetical protein
MLELCSCKFLYFKENQMCVCWYIEAACLFSSNNLNMFCISISYFKTAIRLLEEARMNINIGFQLRFGEGKSTLALGPYTESGVFVHTLERRRLCATKTFHKAGSAKYERARNVTISSARAYCHNCG